MTVWTVPGRVTRVVDGDTLIIDLDLGWHIWRMGERCRLAGINAPEMNTEAGKAAARWVIERLTPPCEVTFVSKGLDKYGRPLGFVNLADGSNLNALILQAGHAVPSS